MSENPRKRREARNWPSEDPNLGQKEAEQEKARFEDEHEDDEADDELEPIEQGAERKTPPSRS